MYIFSRTRAIKPAHMIEGIQTSKALAAKVTAMTGVNINLYRVVFGFPVGTVLFSCRVETQAALGDMFAKLATDAGYAQAAQDAANVYEGAATDGLTSVVSSTLTAPKPIVWVTQATIANGKFAAAMALGVEIQGFVGTATGLPTAFCSDPYGAYGQVRWLTSADTMADMDQVSEVLSTNAEFASMLDRAGECFLPGSGQNALLQLID
jgi:hypothetical protein